MDFKKILEEIEHADPKVFEQLSGRRELVKSFGTKVAIAAMPLAIGSLFFSKKAAAQTTVTDNNLTENLNFVLELAYFQYNFYRTANSTCGLIPTSTNNSLGFNDLPGFKVIEANELAHINFLNTAIAALGATPYTPKNYVATNLEPFYVPTAYDFTMGGTYSTVFSNYATFLIIAQTFQDTFVRCLKGQMQAVLSNTTLLTNLFQIHSTEARHAAHVRTVRRYTNAPEHPAPWITNDIAPIPALQTTYNGEDNLTQINGTIINTLPDAFDPSGVVPKISATAAFDEPLDLTIVKAFIAPFML